MYNKGPRGGGNPPKSNHTNDGESKPLYRFQLYLLDNKEMIIFLYLLVLQGIKKRYYISNLLNNFPTKNSKRLLRSYSFSKKK
jgi:hypothetical protein